MKKIKVEHYTGIHYHAMCDACDFSSSIQTNETRTRAEVRNAVRKHVRKTGHMVLIESGETAYYSLES